MLRLQRAHRSGKTGPIQHRGHDFVKLSIIKGHYEAQMALKLQDLAALREQASKQAELARGKALPKSTGRLEGVAKF